MHRVGYARRFGYSSSDHLAREYLACQPVSSRRIGSRVKEVSLGRDDRAYSYREKRDSTFSLKSKQILERLAWFAISSGAAAVAIKVGQIAIPLIGTIVMGALKPALCFTGAVALTCIILPAGLVSFIPATIYSMPWLLQASGGLLAWGGLAGSTVLSVYSLAQAISADPDKLF